MELLITFIAIVFDFITGLISAIKGKNFSSSIMREGLFHKVGSLLFVVLGFGIDYSCKYLDLGVEVPITEGICVYIVLMEIGSIIENIGKINPNLVPSNVSKYFEKLTKKE